MSGMKIPLKKFEAFSGENKSKTLKELVEKAKSKGNGSSVLSHIHQFESRSGMSTEEMLRKLKCGEIRESVEITNWLIAWESKKIADGKSSSARSK